MGPTTEGIAMIATTPRTEPQHSACLRKVIGGASRWNFFVVICLLMVGEQAMATDNLEQGFARPPNDAKPWVYWWFQGGYGDAQGMARDIAAMKEKGVGGVMHMQTINSGGLPVLKEPKMLSPEWDAWFGEMLRVAHDGGMTLLWGGSSRGRAQLICFSHSSIFYC